IKRCRAENCTPWTSRLPKEVFEPSSTLVENGLHEYSLGDLPARGIGRKTDRRQRQSEGIMSEGIQNEIAPALSQFCHEHQSEMLSVLKQAVEIESPSDNKAGLER